MAERPLKRIKPPGFIDIHASLRIGYLLKPIKVPTARKPLLLLFRTRFARRGELAKKKNLRRCTRRFFKDTEITALPCISLPYMEAIVVSR